MATQLNYEIIQKIIIKLRSKYKIHYSYKIKSDSWYFFTKTQKNLHQNIANIHTNFVRKLIRLEYKHCDHINPVDFMAVNYHSPTYD